MRRELAIGVAIAARLAQVVEICTTKAELRSGHTSWQNRQQIVAKSIIYSMVWCTITHLHQELAIGVAIAARLALVVEICTTKAELRSGHTSRQNQQQI
eukprot:1167628-Rhodomonas_salina.1